MGETSIEWTDFSWNPVTGCSQVSPGCDHCYAIRVANRFRDTPAYAGTVRGMEWTGQVICHQERLLDPFSWRKPRKVFLCSMGDLFHPAVPWSFICDIFEVMAVTPQHTYQVLTKRPGRMAHFANHIWPVSWRERLGVAPEEFPGAAWPANVWAGTSVESAKYLPRLDVLARVPAKVRFVSCEPLLGPLDLLPWLGNNALCTRCAQTCGDRPDCGCEGCWTPGVINWTICGGESGPGARPMRPNWVRDIRDQCQAAGVPFFFKQWGEWLPDNQVTWPPSAKFPPDPDLWHKRGKKAAGALLDGRQHVEFPEVA